MLIMRLILLFPALIIMILLAVIFTVTVGKVMTALQNPDKLQPITGLIAAKKAPDAQSLISDPRNFENLTASDSPPP